MAGKYVQPHEVTSPQRRWSLIAVLFDPRRPGDCALALGRWDNNPVLAMRWNGDEGNPLGNPQSRGLATWFIVPERYYEGLLATLPADKLALARNFIPAPAR